MCISRHLCILICVILVPIKFLQKCKILAHILAH